VARASARAAVATAAAPARERTAQRRRERRISRRVKPWAGRVMGRGGLGAGGELGPAEGGFEVVDVVEVLDAVFGGAGEEAAVDEEVDDFAEVAGGADAVAAEDEGGEGAEVVAGEIGEDVGKFGAGEVAGGLVAALELVAGVVHAGADEGEGAFGVGEGRVVAVAVADESAHGLHAAGGGRLFFPFAAVFVFFFVVGHGGESGEGVAETFGEGGGFGGGGVGAGDDGPACAVAVPAGDDVEVDVGDGLAGGFAVGLEEVDAVGAEDLGLDLGDALGDGEDLGEEVVGEVPDGVEVLLGDDEDVAGHDGADVHEGENVVVLVDLGGGDFAGDDVAEDAVFVHGMSFHGMRGAVGFGGAGSSAGRSVWRTTTRTRRPNAKRRTTPRTKSFSFRVRRKQAATGAAKSFQKSRAGLTGGSIRRGAGVGKGKNGEGVPDFCVPSGRNFQFIASKTWIFLVFSLILREFRKAGRFGAENPELGQ
jgi:hypothetical protein